MRGSAEWKPKLRWLIRRMRLLRSLEAAVVEAESDCVEDRVAVAADRAGELDEWLEPWPGGPGQPGVEVRRGERGIFELVEDS